MKIKKFFNDKRNILIFILAVFISIIISSMILNNRFILSDLVAINFWLFLLVFCCICFLFSHFIFNIKDIYSYIYNNRFKISILLLLILVLGKFHGSSIGMWNDYIQSNEDYSNTTIVGKPRAFRSDEWLVNTPFAFSQKYNKYYYYNSFVRASKTDMFSSIFTPIADVIILTRPFNIGYLIMGTDYGLSFYWYGRLIALFLVSFEFIMLITKKNKLISLMGSFLIVGSPIVSWFYSNYIVDLLISGQLCILMFNQFLKSKKNKSKIFYSILIAFAFNWFILTLYPAWQIPLGYMYLIFAIWIFIKNYKNNKKLCNYKYLLITIILIIMFICRYLLLGKDALNSILSTVYPGSREILGGNGNNFNFTYPFSIFFPFHSSNDPAGESVYSLFPLTIIVPIFYLMYQKIKNKKNTGDKSNLLILMLTILVSIFTLFSIFKLPRLFVNITLLKMVTTKRIAPIIAIVCAYLLILTIGKIKISEKKHYFIMGLISILSGCLITYVCYLCHPTYLTKLKIVFSAFILCSILFLYLISYKKIASKLLCIMLIVIGALNIIFVNPVSFGTDVIYKKDFSREIKKIVKKDKEGRWMSIDSITLSNFIIMNGGKAINSTNIYPNIRFWKKLDSSGKYKKIYNRYAHIPVYFTEKETKFELVQCDVFNLYLNYDDIGKISIDYFVSNGKLEIPDKYKSKFSTIYSKDNIFVYKYIS